MNPIPSKYATRVLAHQTRQNGRIGPSLRNSHALRVGGFRLKSHSSIEQNEKSATSQPSAKPLPNHHSPTAGPRKGAQNATISGKSKVFDDSAHATSVKDDANNMAQNDSPLPYHNALSEWQDASSLSPYLRKHPSVYKAVKFLYDGFGLYAKQSDAVRTGKKAYMGCCERDIVEEKWIYDACRIPRTFHSWFQITNLHVWLLTVRFRALPSPHGRYILQAFVDFFFQDIEDRLRALLGPRISERTITSYMKEYRDLWNGSQLALDIGLVGGDWELAGALWRNLFDAKGWDLGGVVDDNGHPSAIPPHQAFTPPSNPSDSVADTKPLRIADMPQTIYTLVAYLRRELKRLEEVPDEVIIQTGDTGPWGSMDDVHGRDNAHQGPFTSKELERWKKVTDEIGAYR